MGSGDKTGDKKRILTPKMFKSLISGVKYEFEEDDAVKAPFEELCKIHSLLTENGYKTFSSLKTFMTDYWDELYFYEDRSFAGARQHFSKPEKIIDTDLFIELITCSNKQEKQMENLNEKIVIPAQLLRDGYKAANPTQKEFISTNCNALTGETTKDQLKELYNKISKGCTWRAKLEKEFPFLKQPEPIVIKYGEKVDGHELFGHGHSLAMIQPRIHGLYNQKAFYLGSCYNWEIIKDDDGFFCLVPTRKF